MAVDSSHRDPNIDALRGLGISLIVLSHAVTEAKVGVAAEPMRLAMHSTLYILNVQLLAFVSGLVARRPDVALKARTLLVPLMTWLIVYNLPARPDFFASLSRSPSGIAGVFSGYSPLWFLWALFASFGVVCLLSRQRWTLVAVALGAAVLWPLAPAWTLVRGVGLVLPFLVLGATWRRAASERTRRVERLWPLLLLAFVALALTATRLVGGPVWIGSALTVRALPLQLLLVAASAIGCVGMLGLVRCLDGPLLRWLALLGTGSMGIYGFHWLLIVLFPELTSASTLPGIPVVWLALLIVSATLTALVARSRVSSALLLGGRLPSWSLLSNKRFQQTRKPALDSES